MKTSIVLNTLQLVVIVILCITVMAMRGQLQTLQKLAQDQTTAYPAAGLAQQQTDAAGFKNPVPRVDSSAALTLEQIQKVLRAELTRFKASLPAVSDGRDSSPPVQSNQADLLDQQLQFELVNQELDFYIQQGMISEQDMSNLQYEIAKLNPEGKKQAMSRLVRAINSGELDGRL